MHMPEKLVRSQNPSNRSAAEASRQQSRDVDVLTVSENDWPRRRELQDQGMTMAELVEVVYKLVKRENVSPFPLCSHGREIAGRIIKPSRRPATAGRRSSSAGEIATSCWFRPALPTASSPSRTKARSATSSQRSTTPLASAARAGTIRPSGSRGP